MNSKKLDFLLIKTKHLFILEKDYYKGPTLLKKENIFDSRITYCYEFKDKENIVCKNCGMTGNLSDFNNGCPYCHSSFNMEYHKKELFITKLP